MKRTLGLNNAAILKSNNVLELSEPETFYCRVLRYEQGHSVMYIYIRKSQELNSSLANTFVLILEPVLYFEGPLWWEGANFSIGPLDECVSLLWKMQTREEVSMQAVQEVVQQLAGNMSSWLLKVGTGSLKNKIIAQYAALYDYPDWLAEEEKRGVSPVD